MKLLKRFIGYAIAGLFLTSCETLAPQAAAIVVTDEADKVSACQVLGAVESTPPYVGPNDGVNQLRNKAAALGADTLFLTGRGPLRGKSGMAYKCGATK
jgi:hypothetical protein